MPRRRVDGESNAWDSRVRYLGFRPIRHRELPVGVEPTTSSLPRTRSTTELRQRLPAGDRATGERAMGIEPTTSCLEGKSSTVELRPQVKDEVAKTPGNSSLPRVAARQLALQHLLGFI